MDAGDGVYEFPYRQSLGLYEKFAALTQTLPSSLASHPTHSLKHTCILVFPLLNVSADTIAGTSLLAVAWSHLSWRAILQRVFYS